MKSEEFICYRSGIKSSIIILDENKIYHRLINYYTGEISDAFEINSDDTCYGVPSYKIFELLKYSKINSFQTDFYIDSKYHYKKYLNIHDDSKGDASIYAELNTKSPTDLVIFNNTIVGLILPSREGCITIVKEGYECFTIQREWENSNCSRDSYLVEYIGNFMVKMRDGVKLSTDVYLPRERKENDRFPAVLIRTCYGKMKIKERYEKYVKRGYAVVIQDVRGRDDSEGKWIPFYCETEDGDDTINWIADQSFSNGDVGMIGGSYLGYVQWAAAGSGNSHLKALVSIVTAGSAFVDLPRKGGTYQSCILAWSFMVSGKKTNESLAVRKGWKELLSHRPIKEIPKIGLGYEIGFYNEWMKHQENDEFWNKGDWSLYRDKINVPALYVSGWFDDDGMGTTQSFEMNQANNRENQRMILGPWIHKANTTREIHNLQLDCNSLRYDLDLLYLRWFDKFLKGVNNGVDKENKVEYYVLGENSWRSSDKWPPKEAAFKNLYLHSNGNANSSKGDGYLDFKPPIDEVQDNYEFDPYSPFPYLIDVSENENAVPENYKDAELREDVLVYTSEILKENITIAGDIYAEIYASSSCKDTDWVVRLTDVDELGNSLRLSDGIIRARYRNSFEKTELLEEGKVEKYRIRMTKIAYMFKKGHRIRIQVTSGAEGFCFPNSNTGENECEVIKLISAEQKIYHDKNHLTHIEIPVLKDENKLLNKC